MINCFIFDAIFIWCNCLLKCKFLSEWSVEEDALAFLTDAGLVGRLTMAQQGRWPVDDSNEVDLEHKIGESIWWLMVLADRMGINSEEALENFLSTTEKRFNL